MSRPSMDQLIQETLKLAVKNNASDVHFSSGMPPVLRIMGQLRQVEAPVLDKNDLNDFFLSMLGNDQKEHFLSNNELDFALQLENISRFRVNFYRHMNGISGAFRVINQNIRSLQEMRMPVVLRRIVENRKGLVLVTGPTGSGKSTTLAAMLHEINQERREHIITIEDPVEYVHEPQRCLIHQREVGFHTKNFAAALRAALREDPDVILVGEMRDTETITNALRAAETGHLVFSTLHTNSAPETIDRIINVFPSEMQQQVRQLLAATLIGVISQRLVPKAMEKDRVAIMEVLVNTDAVRNLVREGKTHQIDSMIQTGAEFGMQSFERSLADLRQNNIVSPQTKLADFV